MLAFAFSIPFHYTHTVFYIDNDIFWYDCNVKISSTFDNTLAILSDKLLDTPFGEVYSVCYVLFMWVDCVV